MTSCTKTNFASSYFNNYEAFVREINQIECNLTCIQEGIAKCEAIEKSASDDKDKLVNRLEGADTQLRYNIENIENVAAEIQSYLASQYSQRQTKKIDIKNCTNPTVANFDTKILQLQEERESYLEKHFQTSLDKVMKISTTLLDQLKSLMSKHHEIPSTV